MASADECPVAVAVGLGSRVVAKSADGDEIDDPAGLSMPSPVEAHAGGNAGGDRDRRYPAEAGEGCFVPEPVEVLASADEQLVNVDRHLAAHVPLRTRQIHATTTPGKSLSVGYSTFSQASLNSACRSERPLRKALSAKVSFRDRRDRTR
jgi:hypothetical protein